MKIGALLPRSTFHLLLQHDFLAGTEAYLQYRQTGAELISGQIKYGTDANVVMQEAERLLLEQQVDILLVYADQDSLKQIADLAKALNKLIILVHNGAKYMHEWEPHPAVLSHTLNNTVHCRLTGEYAATKAASAAVCTSFYDGGYSHCHAMTQTYADKGGSVAYNFISQYKVSEFNSAPLQEFLKNNADVQTLLALFNGDLAHCFLQQLQHAGISPLRIFGSPMLLDETIPLTHGPLQLPFQLCGYVPWTPVIDSEANTLFKTQFRQHTGREAGIAALHGWDTGIILEHILRTADTHRFKARDILEMMKEVTLDSPGGSLQMDAATHHMIGPSWLIQMNEQFEPQIIGSIDNTLHTWQEIVSTKLQGVSSGWINTYLCA
ncbi:ABC transporter substrate-binding protein [Chitinophaga sp. HK235]|uniref:ABC transporter substrate-binding protein n=1 Tax=Chitinophaga sp. HK235 TaxID=2952571 RepID=UPI001BA64CF2|nr:ABC transporter substrate-binding protein [Chitinophaga sp. HK235]